MPGFGTEYLSKLNDAICDDPERIIQELDVPWEVKNGRVSHTCGVHNGDKQSSFTWYLEEMNNSPRGKWRCQTRSCHTHFVDTSIGLVRGVLSGQKFNWTKPGDRTVPFREVVEFLSKLYNIDREGEASEGDAEKKGLPVTFYTGKISVTEVTSVLPGIITYRNVFYNRITF